MNIRKDLAIGDVGEKIVMSLLTAVSIQCVQAPGKGRRPSYDLEFCLQDKNYTIEVKYDLYASKSGNVAIEVYNPKSCKNSGLTATKANLWCHIVDGHTYCAKVSDLHDFVKQNAPFRVICRGGDGNATLYLYKMEHILPAIFIDLTDMNKNTLVKTITRMVKNA